MKGTTDEKVMPHEILQAYVALQEGFRGAQPVALIRLRTREDGPYHYICALIEEDGSASPIAVFPAPGQSVHSLLSGIEKLGVEADPDYKGVKM